MRCENIRLIFVKSLFPSTFSNELSKPHKALNPRYKDVFISIHPCLSLSTQYTSLSSHILIGPLYISSTNSAESPSAAELTDLPSLPLPLSLSPSLSLPLSLRWVRTQESETSGAVVLEVEMPSGYRIDQHVANAIVRQNKRNPNNALMSGKISPSKIYWFMDRVS